MNTISSWIAGAALAAFFVLGAALLIVTSLEDAHCPDGLCPIAPQPPHAPPAKPKPAPAPKKPRPAPCPSVNARCQTVGLASESVKDERREADKASWVNGRESDGEALTADFPGSLYMQNIGSKRDGAGMCVMTSIEILCKYLGLRQYFGLRDWCALEAGGANRQKVEDQIARFEKVKGVAKPIPFLNYEGPDPGPVLEAIDKARLPFAITYGWSPRYRQRIAHMVANCKFSGRLSAVLDNNPMTDLDPANNRLFEWMSKEEMLRRAKLGQGGNVWIFAWLAPPPPPCPKVK